MACLRSYRSTNILNWHELSLMQIMISNEIIHIPIMSFRANSVMFYKVSANHRFKLLQSSLFNENSNLLKSRKRYVGFVTDGIKKRMKKCITLLIQSTPWQYKWNPVTQKTVSHKLSFITLTTPKHENSYSAKFCHKQLLEPLLRELRRKHGLKSYIWKCELQQNKQIHYHLTCDIVINHTTLRDIWNNLLKKHGMLEAFQKEYGHDNPNSTDVHSVYRVKNLEAYLVKYICKEYQNEEALDGKVWDASMNIKANDYFKFEVDSVTALLIRQLQDTKQVVTQYFEKAINFDFRTSDYHLFFMDTIIDNFYKHLNFVRSWEKSLHSARTILQTKLLKPITSSTNVSRLSMQTYLELT